MAFPMTSMKRSKSGAYKARKGIPKDVRAEYKKLHGPVWEEQFHAPAGTSLSSAKALHSEWLADIENRVAAIRASVRGEGRELTRRQAHGLAGEWYRWFVSTWWSDRGAFVEKLQEFAPAWFMEHPERDPEWGWSKEPEARTQMPRAFKASAMSLSVPAPARRMSRMMGSTLAAC